MAQRKRTTNLVLLALGFGCCFLNASIPIISEWFRERRSDSIAFGVHGILAAEIIILAIWAALGPGTFGKRFLATLILGLLPAAAAGMGYYATHPGRGMPGALADALLLSPILFLSLQAPLLPMRRSVRIQLTDSLAADSDKLQFGLQSLLTVTAIIALALGGARYAVSRDTHNPLEPFGSLGILCGVVAVGGLMFAVPPILICQFFRNWGKRFLGSLMHGFALVAAPFLFLIAFDGLRLLREPSQAGIILALFIAVTLLGVHAGISVLGRLGYTISPRRASNGSIS